MRSLVGSYGRTLTAIFMIAAAVWGLMLIILPQINMLDLALRTPPRQHDSSIAYAVIRDAETCRTVLDTYRGDSADGTTSDGGLASPSPGGMVSPSPGGSVGSNLPYIIQCDRANTAQQLIRDNGEDAYLNLEYEIETLSVDPTADLETQFAQAEAVQAAATALYQELLAAEANVSPYGLNNFAAILESRTIPLSEQARAEADSNIGSMLQNAVGLRYEQDGVVRERITLTTLVRTILFAVMATGLALIACYPIAYGLALQTAPQRAVWLFLALIIPYATVEIMRV